ncbi:MAG: hypothetical protein KBH41_20160, partial [Azonexus sp.]|nr:hypothetical protein [Azonexus sp.]
MPQVPFGGFSPLVQSALNPVHPRWQQTESTSANDHPAFSASLAIPLIAVSVGNARFDFRIASQSAAIASGTPSSDSDVFGSQVPGKGTIGVFFLLGIGYWVMGA